MGRVTRRHDIDRTRRRRLKLKKLRLRIARAKNTTEIQKCIEKIKKIHPHYPIQSLSK